MRKPICVKCEVEFVRVKSGVLVRELFQQNKEIYKVWSADLLECPGCGSRVISDFAYQPMAHHFEEERMKSAMEVIRKREPRGDVFNCKEVLT